MSDYSAVGPPQQNFNQSTAFAAALQRAKQIAAKINPGSGTSDPSSQKRPLEDVSDPFAEPNAKKGPASLGPPQGPPLGGRPPSQMGMGGPGQGMGGPGGLGGGANEDIRVPDKMVGLIIGRGGEQITRLQAETGCKIQMAPDSQGMPDRICSLSGTKDAVVRAKEAIMSIVLQRGRSEGLGGPDMNQGPPQQGHNNFNSGGMNSMGPPNGGPMGGGGRGGGNFVEIMIPGPKVGLIIGKGGETIKQLQEKSGAKMVVIQDGPNPEQEKPLRISGDPMKVDMAKQLVYDLLAEKEIQSQNFQNNRGGGGGNRGRNDRNNDFNDGGYGNGPGGDVEVLVPRNAVGIVIGKGGDMIKKIQAETGCRVQFQQNRDEGPGDRRCFLSGSAEQIEEARGRIDELIDGVNQREQGGDRRGGGGRGGRGGGRFGGDDRGNRNGRDGGYGGRDDRWGGNQGNEVTFTVPSNKCGVIIGRGGETIKQINSQSGAKCELDRNNQDPNASHKTFIIRGDTECIEECKRLIQDKIQMNINFMPLNPGGGMGNNMPTAYPGMAPQGYNPQQAWGVAGYPGQAQQAPQQQPQWGAAAGGDAQGAGAPGMGAAGAGGADYSLQWAEYYRSLGMMREAEMIEQQAKNKGSMVGQPGAAPAAAPQPAAPVAAAVAPAAAAGGAANGQPDYSAQWADYYRSIGKIKEAEAIEAQMKQKQGGAQPAAAGVAAAGAASAGSYSQPQQQTYAAAYQGAAGGYYAGQNQAAVGAAAQGQYGAFAGYGYGIPNQGQQPNQDN